MYDQDIKKLQRAYHICFSASLLCALIAFPLSHFLEQRPLLCALLMLPALILSAAAAVLNHRLPPEQREQLTVSYRSGPSHPYWFLFMLLVMEVLLVLSSLSPSDALAAITPIVSCLFLLVEVGVILFYFVRKYLRKPDRKPKQKHRKRKRH